MGFGWSTLFAGLFAAVCCGCAGTKVEPVVIPPGSKVTPPQAPATPEPPARLTEAATLELGSHASEIKAEDVNADGRADIWIPLIGGGVQVYFNASTPERLRLSPLRIDTGIERTLDIRLVDATAAVLPELAVLYTDSGVAVLSQSSPGVFADDGKRVPRSGELVTLDRINSDDSTLDFLFASGSRGGPTVTWMENGDPYNSHARIVDSAWNDRPDNASYTSMLHKDLDGNGLADVVLADELNQAVQLHLHFPQPDKPQYWVDQYGVATPLPQDRIYPSDTSSYQSALVEPWSGRPERLAVTDLDDDGFLDLATIVNSGNVFSSPVPVWTQAPDLLSGGQLPNKTVLIHKLSNDRFRSTFRLALSLPVSINDLCFSDLDLDGDQDLLCCGGRLSQDGGSYLVVYENIAPFRFADPIMIPMEDDAYRLCAMDLNADQYRDVVVATEQSRKLHVFLNGGRGSQFADSLSVPQQPFR